MSQQGGRPTGQEDDWWRQLYDSTDDTGPAPAPDTLDDRFASAAGTVRDGTGGTGSGADVAGSGAGSPRAGTGVPAPRTGFPDETAPAPASFPPGPKPPGFTERAPDGRASTETPPATTVPASRMPTEPPRPPTAPPPPPSAPPRPTAPASSPARDVDGAVSPDRGDSDRGGFGAPVPHGGPGEGVPGFAGSRAGSSGEGFVSGGAAPAPDADAVQEPPAVAPPPRTGPGSTQPNPTPAPQAPRTATRLDLPTLPPAPVGFVGSGPPTYDAEPTALPPADPDELDDLVADTVLDGARYGACTLRAVSVRGDSARFRGEPRRDSLLTARFGTGEQALILVAMATGARATPGAHRAAAEACHWIGRAVGRSHARLAQDIGAARRGDLKSGLHRLTDRSLGKLRASAVEQGIDPEEYAATLRCLLLPADPDCRVRVFFGVGAGGLFRLRDGEWQDIEPQVTDLTGEPVVGFGSLPSETPDGDRLTMDLGIPTPPSPYEPAPEPPREAFRFRASVARPGDALLMCTGGLADPLRGEPELREYLTGRWSDPTPPGLAAFLADSQVRVKGYADDRTAAAVWEA
ncbi:protein phosphatase 2C domain-containing protein [Streptomyces sviceus]|uniref:protein phosphatase 2C domain-containing protein n=1 Tax=Streptomyces sviceus TaxID=285530 RepID=UPI00368DCEDC